jgi:16S rRNA (cytosine967-C5)-methyltransferase
LTPTRKPASARGPKPPRREIEGLEARAAALVVIEAALESRGGLEEALARPPFSLLPPRDRAFGRALAMTVLRRLGQIDQALKAKLQRPPPDSVIALLRLGAAQILFMGAPDFAAVDTTVELTARGKTSQSFKGLVNAVLRGLTRDPVALPDPSALAPDWLASRWRSAYGAEAADRIVALIAEEPSADLSFRDPADGPLLAEGLEARPLPGGAWRTDKRGDLAEWPGFDEGRWWVQDASASVPARLLGAGPGSSVLDLCAAPGGKTLQLAATGATVTAIDRSPGRLKRIGENLARVKLPAELIAADAGDWRDARQFDAVLLDAPCTATGTFRRHPDVLWASRPSDITSLALAQARLLDGAARHVKPGGRLVYCVCSLEPEEGEAQAEGFLSRQADFALEPIAPGEGGAPDGSVTPRGLLRILPFHLEGGADGFFAARFVRKG